MPESAFDEIRKLDTCIVSNAIERLDGRPRNEGSIAGCAVRSIFPHLPPMLGYAVTGRMRSTAMPVTGRIYYENMSWWRYVASIPQPRVIVVQDSDEFPGAGALLGELHATIAVALNCVGYVTNGAVRDLATAEELGLHLFAGCLAVSHMYAHIFEFGEPVELGRVTISPGDLIHGDRHGVHVIPSHVAPEIPAMAAQIVEERRRLLEFCRSSEFSLDRLEEEIEHFSSPRVSVTD